MPEESGVMQNTKKIAKSIHTPAAKAAGVSVSAIIAEPKIRHIICRKKEVKKCKKIF